MKAVLQDNSLQKKQIMSLTERAIAQVKHLLEQEESHP